MYIVLVNVHGLVRGFDQELGRDADTGGQTRYVLELARSLARKPNVDRVDIVTRKLTHTVDDERLDSSYGNPCETVCGDVANGDCRIVRLDCLEGEYVRKECLWPHLAAFSEALEEYLEAQPVRPTVIHGHYADSGLVASMVAEKLSVPFFFTGHSLGLPKLAYLQECGWTEREAIEELCIDERIAAERRLLASADAVIASTAHERDTQYGMYPEAEAARIEVIAPGVDLSAFHFRNDPCNTELAWRDRFFKRFDDPFKPILLAIARPDRRKNLPGLLKAYGESEELQRRANLVVVAGVRDDIQTRGDNERDELTQLLLLRDRYDLEGLVDLPKSHIPARDVGPLYRLARRTGGVFVNPAFIELFGLTCIESAASGLPFIATINGGPQDIVQLTGAGRTVDTSDDAALADGILSMLDDRGIWRQCSLYGESLTPRTYSWEQHASEYLSLVAEFAGTTPIPLNSGLLWRLESARAIGQMAGVAP